MPRSLSLSKRDAGLLLATLLCSIGCQGSSRTVNLGAKEITTDTPIQLDRDSMPFAFSPDGGRIALGRNGAPGRAIVTVLETDSQKKLGDLDIPNGGAGSAIFSRSGADLYLGADDGYVAWNYATGTQRKIARKGPDVQPSRFFDFDGWNYDRTIAIAYPQPPRPKPKKPSIELGGGEGPGQVALAGNITFEIPTDQTAGFDQYGYAWFGKGKSWTRIDRSGQATHARNRPQSLAHDQTRDRASMHLTATNTGMNYKDGQANVFCIWLTDDRAVPYVGIVKGRKVPLPQAYQAAVVFAGPDVLDFGFVPGRNMVYVVSGFGNYLVPFTIAPRPKK